MDVPENKLSVSISRYLLRQQPTLPGLQQGAPIQLFLSQLIIPRVADLLQNISGILVMAHLLIQTTQLRFI